ncbi:MAG: hypothetical protein QNK37_26310 [Acidobacteriota bacterium]|nr:hypothetical protein [Acidobacteriota bacterium]
MRRLVLITSTLLLCGCLSPFYTPPDKARYWEREEEGVYRYRDNDLELELRLEANRTWRWRITNLSLLPMTLEPGAILLRLEGDPAAYTLYGQPVDPALTQPSIVVQPGRFFSVAYPIQFSSPLHPLPLKNGRLRLEMKVSWGGRAYPYRLVFPLEEKSEEK